MKKINKSLKKPAVIKKVVYFVEPDDGGYTNQCIMEYLTGTNRAKNEDENPCPKDKDGERHDLIEVDLETLRKLIERRMVQQDIRFTIWECPWPYDTVYEVEYVRRSVLTSADRRNFADRIDEIRERVEKRRSSLPPPVEPDPFK